MKELFITGFRAMRPNHDIGVTVTARRAGSRLLHGARQAVTIDEFS